MGTRGLYRISIPETALQQRSGEQSQSQEVAKLTGIATEGSVTNVGTNPGEFRVEGQYKGDGAELLAREVSELAGASGINSVAFYDSDTSVASAGYYSVEQIQNRRFRPQKPEVSSFSIRLTREGTLDSHYRHLETNNRQVTHDFGSDATEEIAIPNTATDVQWVSGDRTQNTPATATGTRDIEPPDNGSSATVSAVALYDPTDAPAGYDEPDLSGVGVGLAYQLAYAEAGHADSGVLDTYDRSETDGDGNFQWQQVFESTHEFEGNAVLENRAVRLEVDTTNNSLTAEQWDGGTNSWSSVSLGAAGGWQVSAFDLVEVDPARVYSQFEFTDTDNGSTYRLDCFLHRGWDLLQFAVPQSGSGPIPADLVTYLDPIASPRYTDSRSEAKIISRETLRE